MFPVTIQIRLLCPRDYDWSEQDRVQKAIRAVQEDKSDEMWWRLPAHYGDKRYAMTLVFDTVVNSKTFPWAKSVPQCLGRTTMQLISHTFPRFPGCTFSPCLNHG